MGCGAVAEQMEAQSLDMERLVNILCQEQYNRQGANHRKHTSSLLSGLFFFLWWNRQIAYRTSWYFAKTLVNTPVHLSLAFFRLMMEQAKVLTG